ncbi:hypothetical protein [Streptomyces sp. L2]|nr:hypothetical protein [Streptomyces sp. L2]
MLSDLREGILTARHLAAGAAPHEAPDRLRARAELAVRRGRA